MTTVYALLAASALLNFVIGTFGRVTSDLPTKLTFRVFPMALAFADSFFVVAWIMGWPV